MLNVELQAPFFYFIFYFYFFIFIFLFLFYFIFNKVTKWFSHRVAPKLHNEIVRTKLTVMNISLYVTSLQSYHGRK